VKRRDARGFTLLEVLVALAILCLAVVASIQGFAQGLRLLKLAGDHQQAMLLADEKAREMVAPVPGREEGTDGAFSWAREVKAVEAPELTSVTGANPWHVYQIAVRVRWGESRQVELTTLRTVPPPKSELTTSGPSLSPVPGADLGTAPTIAVPRGSGAGASTPATSGPGAATSGTLSPRLPGMPSR
jgi:general secretion pathway protein I